MANCERCGAELVEGRATCSACGAQVQSTIASEWAPVKSPPPQATSPAAGPQPAAGGFAPVNSGTAPPASGANAEGFSSVKAANTAAAASTPPPGVFPVGSGASATAARDDGPAFAPVAGGAATTGQGAAAPGFAPGSQATAFPQATTNKKSPLLKILAGVFIFLFLLAAAGVAGVVYLVHRAKQKVHQLESEYNRNSLQYRSSTAARRHSNNTPAPPALKPDSKPAPLVAQAATGDRAHDWALQYERTENTSEADLVVRAGSINNLGFGWPDGFDPFSGDSTPMHAFPWKTPDGVADGTDRIMLGTSVSSSDISHPGDGYSGILYDCREKLLADANCQTRHDAMPRPITLPVGALPSKINDVMFQIFVDDFQAPVFKSHFQVSLNGTRIPSFEEAVNALDQTGPIGKLISLRLLPEYWPLLQSGNVKLLIDDPTTHIHDGYAVDFVRILVNPHALKYKVSLTVHVVDAKTHKPIPGATATAALETCSTDKRGQCELKDLPAGLVMASATNPGYDANSVQTDLPAGHTGTAEIPLQPHQEDTASLEKSIDQTGTATLYGIHFDTGSAKLRPDSLPSLQAILGVIQKRTGRNWVIAGHTDNQGSDATNVPLSQSRAASVIAWLVAHGVDQGSLEPQGYGASRPVADNATANGRQLNRRVEFSAATKP
jgi:OmpA-OmpF porin, OOP family